MALRRIAIWIPTVLMALLLLGPEVLAATKVRVGLFPFGASRMVDEWIKDNGILKKWGKKYNLEMKISHPRDDFAAFMGKSVEMVALSTMEIARLVGDEGHDIIMYGRQVDAFTSMYVRTNSSYKTPVDVKGKKIAHPGWDTGSAQMGSILFKEWYGVNLKKDFRVVTAPWPVVPQLLAKGDVELAINLVPLTMKLEMSGKIRPLFSGYAMEWAKRRGTGHHLSITNFTSWGKWVRANETAARAFLGAYTEGQKYAHAHTIDWANKYKTYIAKNATDAQVNWYVNWFKKNGVVYPNAYIDQKFIDEETAFLKLALKAGLIKPAGINDRMWKILKPL